jgi:hypothetical protein
MAKTLARKRSPEAEVVMEDTAEHLLQRAHSLEKQYGWHSPEAWEARLIAAAMYCAVEDYDNVEPLLAGNVAAQKGKEGSNPMWMFWALSLLFEAYANLNRIPEAIRISKEGRSIAKKTDASAKDPFLEALVQQAIALEAKGHLESRQRGFVVALLTLSWYVSHGFDRSRADAPVQDQLHVLFKSYGIGDEEWEWAVKHAHLTKYDFVGLLSTLLPHTGLAPTPLEPVLQRKSRIY